ncbi:MAG: phosphate acyltransferase [Candidatus Omnitrophica bacterium]|nr:phosphate acyltransferase [Candidatus Omnitrophota bacterium]
MDTIKKLRQKAKKDLKTIVLPESEDKRIRQAAEIVEEEGIAKVLLLSQDKIDSKEKERYIQEFYERYKNKGFDIERVKTLFEDPMYYAAMMTKEAKVDGLVAGATHTTPEVARCCIRCLGVDEESKFISSCFIMVVPDCSYGEAGTFIFADCGIIPEPSALQLACISLSAARLAREVLEIKPRIALLSYSTKSSEETASNKKIRQALQLIKEMAPELLVDGELQVDSAIVPEVARIKYPDSVLKGRANILIFPDLEAGNISYKLVQRLANARAVGPLFLGLKRPASDLSRGCLVEDIVDCIAVTAIRAKVY